MHIPTRGESDGTDVYPPENTVGESDVMVHGDAAFTCRRRTYVCSSAGRTEREGESNEGK